MTTKDINFWLNEKELTTPIHDKMVMFCFNNTFEILQELNLIPNKRIVFFKGSKYGDIKWNPDNFILSINYIDDETAKNERGIILDELEVIKKIPLKSYFNIKNELEFNLSQPNGWNIGFIDLKSTVLSELNSSLHFDYLIKDRPDIELYFEIKPEVKSIGEVMRQLNFYKKYLPPKSTIILVTKTIGLKELFKSQDIYVYEYKEDENGNK